MADRINFDKKINDSVQAGDALYQSDISSGSATSHTLVGEITGVGEKYIDVATGDAPAGFATADVVAGAITPFFTFQKPVDENISSLKGYHAEVEFINNSSIKQELFAVGSEITMSSK